MPAPDILPVTLPDNFFMGGRNITKRGGALVRSLNSRTPQTETYLHVYADGTDGDDDNDGLSAAKPKLTLGAVFALVPYVVAHDVVIHLTGTFNDFGTVLLSKHVVAGAYLFIDGGENYTSVAGPFTATGSGVATITDGAAGQATDTYAGYLCRILDGVQAGNHRQIQGHTATVFTPSANFAADPGIGTSFDVARPTTELAATGTFSRIRVNCTGSGIAWLQNLYTSGTNMSLQVDSSTISVFVGCSVFASSANGSLNCLNNSQFATTQTVAETVTLPLAAISGIKAGLSVVAGRANFANMYLEMMGFYSVWTAASQCAIYSFYNGSRFNGPAAFRSCFSRYGVDTLRSSAGYAVMRAGNAAGIGVLVDGNSSFSIGSADISGSGSHGVECIASRVDFTGITTSNTTNTGLGCYAHMGSQVSISDGAPPTLDGTVGEYGSSNPAAQDATWAGIDAATPEVTPTEVTICKEV